MSKDKNNLKHLSQKERSDNKKAREAALAAAIEREKRKNQHILEMLAKAKEKEQLPENMRILEEISPKFGEHLRHNHDLLEATKRVMTQPFIKSVESWKPQGKSYQSLFNSLANHLFAKYKTPPFIWSAFAHHDALLHKLACFVGAGNSLYNFAKQEKDFKVPVTRQMSHTFMQCTNEFTIIQAIRYAQFIGFGGNKRLYEGFKHSIADRQLVNDEEFNSSTIQWLCNQPMLDPNQVNPIIDYFNHCRNEDGKYSLKGRNADSVLKKVEEWHAQLQKRKFQRTNIKFTPSGFKGAVYDLSSENNKQIWRVFELLTSDALYDEGRRMGHCVGSYSHSVEAGQCSIWALTLEDNEGNWAMNTIEVDRYGRLVQIRGKHNRAPTAKEQNILSRWANEKGLKY